MGASQEDRTSHDGLDTQALPGEEGGSDVLRRFLRYVRVDSQGVPSNSGQIPSSACQLDMTRLLAQELRDLGAQDVVETDHAYVIAHFPASPDARDMPTLAFNAHVDTEASVPGNGVRPHIERYDGGKLVMGVVDGREVYTDQQVNPELSDLVGQDIVVTDGSTLLGGDDKAGIAEIMALLARFAADPSLPHPRIAVSFVPDEEIGHGAALLDLEEHGAAFGYTLDGGPLGVMNYETFNAAEADVHIQGFSVHPGTAKGRMLNAIDIACEYNALLPQQSKPQYTDGYDGFIHLHQQSGNVESADALYIIRDHDSGRFEQKKQLVAQAARYLNDKYGSQVVSVKVEDTYLNMAQVIEKHPHLIDNARKAFAAHGVEMWTEPMRGGTDGAQLCFRGLPMANLSCGYHNAHGIKEFVPVRELEVMVDVLQTLCAEYAQGPACD